MSIPNDRSADVSRASIYPPYQISLDREYRTRICRPSSHRAGLATPEWHLPERCSDASERSQPRTLLSRCLKAVDNVPFAQTPDNKLLMPDNAAYVQSIREYINGWRRGSSRCRYDLELERHGSRDIVRMLGERATNLRRCDRRRPTPIAPCTSEAVDIISNIAGRLGIRRC